jgi:hypothetical protein
MSEFTTTHAREIRLGEIAHARSGDKGNHANIGVIAWTDAGFLHLRRELTPERVLQFFSRLRPESVERFELPGVRAVNFVLKNVLGGGASRSLRTDSQGKVLGPAILELRLPAPEDLAALRRPATPARESDISAPSAGGTT